MSLIRSSSYMDIYGYNEFWANEYDEVTLSDVKISKLNNDNLAGCTVVKPSRPFIYTSSVPNVSKTSKYHARHNSFYVNPLNNSFIHINNACNFRLRLESYIPVHLLRNNNIQIWKDFSFDNGCAIKKIAAHLNDKEVILDSNGNEKCRVWCDFDIDISLMQDHGYLQFIAGLELEYNGVSLKKDAMLQFCLHRFNIEPPMLAHIYCASDNRFFVPLLSDQTFEITFIKGCHVNDSSINSYVATKDTKYTVDPNNVYRNIFYRYKCHNRPNQRTQQKQDCLLVQGINSNTTVLSYSVTKSNSYLIGHIQASYKQDSCDYVFTNNVRMFWLKFRDRDISKLELFYDKRHYETQSVDKSILISIKNPKLLIKWTKVINADNSIRIVPSCRTN